MVHAGCGAEVIKNRRDTRDLRKMALSQGIVLKVDDFKPAKNKKYPYYTPARDKDVFNRGRRDWTTYSLDQCNQTLSCSIIRSYHRRNDIQTTIANGRKTVIVFSPQLDSGLKEVSEAHQLKDQVKELEELNLSNSSIELTYARLQSVSAPKSGFREEIGRLFIFQIEQLDGADGIYRASSSANVILYVGLGMLAIGLVITFVGLGDKGFKTLELKLIGPSLVGCGVFFCLLRVLFCTVPSCCSSCFQCCKSSEEKKALINPQTDAKASSVSNGAGSKKAGLAVVRGSSSESRRRVAPASAGIQENRPHPNFGEENGRENFEKQEGQRESFRQREIRTAKSCTGSIEPAPTNKERPASKSHSDKHAKPLSYDNYSTSGSSEFSFSAVNNTDILRSAEASQAASSENDDKFVNKLASADYPDYNTIPQFPVLNGTPIHQFDQLVTKAELRG
eukprot:maker-scaffold523_size146679-snap-gene-0.18 protein:Tk01366 transcript:maker-scaffold523_size146679-snap-gene-0.18-mRNA-1 annotation:"hypothetical protein AND_001798"